MKQINKQLELKKLDSKQRLHHVSIPIVAITGNIGSGKSTLLKILNELKCATLQADQLIKKIYTQPETLQYVQNLAPDVMQPNQQINFKKLRELFFSDPQIKNQLEHFLHQKLPAAFRLEADYYIQQGHQVIYYELPLLFEKSMQSLIDMIVLVTTSSEIQQERVVARDGLAPELIHKIKNQQIPQDQKIPLSHWIIPNDGNLDHLQQEVQALTLFVQKALI